jgi:hypothetical protein
MESIIGKIELIFIPESTLAKLFGISIILELKKVIISIIILQINQAKRDQSELIKISLNCVSFGQNHIFL